MADTKEKTGVFTGTYAINPVTSQPIPIWVADYVMMGYGTGAIMAVPAHDTRDFEFAQKFKLPIVQVVQPPEGVDWHGYVDDGIAVNSGEYDGLPTPQFKKKITEDLDKAGLGCEAINYKLRDWLFSRQRYWGEPFPIIHCDVCGTVALDERDLPLVLPEMDDFTPISSNDPNALPQPPLGKATQWASACPLCGAMSRRELNTMPQWAGSCWYYLRYLDPKNDRKFVDPKIEKYWMSPAARNRSRRIWAWICTSAGPSTPCCTCSTRGSGTRCCSTWAREHTRAVRPPVQPGHDHQLHLSRQARDQHAVQQGRFHEGPARAQGVGRGFDGHDREDVQGTRTSSTPMTSSANTAPTPSVCTRCSWARWKAPSRGTHATFRACTGSSSESGG